MAIHIKMKEHDALLILQDDRVFWGNSLGCRGITAAEVCFTTGMTGYQHTITDPSFANQIITFAFPHIGNIGINHTDYERNNIFTKGVILREKPIEHPSHSSSYISLDKWLKEKKIVGIYGIDTRALIRHLRSHGSINGAICSQDTIDTIAVKKHLTQCPDMKGQELSKHVSNFHNDNNLSNKKKNQLIAIVDFGMKNSIANKLQDFNVVIIPAQNNFAQAVLAHNPDGMIFSNGPGDPEATAQYATKEINILLQCGIPIFAICLGHQLLSITLGCKTIKMNHGHRGINHPVYNRLTNAIEITSQNHGFVVDDSNIPKNIEITHHSLFDGSIEGIKVKNKPIFSVQYHPEGCPGPNDSNYLFKQFINEITHRTA